MTTISELVTAAGGLLHKRDLVEHGATDRHLTAAVRAREVRRPRRGWYSTWPRSDPRFVAVAVGGRLAGASALHLLGAWSWPDRPPDIVVSVPRTASRLRRRRGVRVVWDGPDVADRGGLATVDPRDALARAVVEAPNLESAVVLADWARSVELITEADDRAVLGRHRPDAAGLADWSDGGAQSILESAAGTRLRLAGRVVERQVVVGPRGEAVDHVVDGTASLETDGREHHADHFERDRRKDLLTIAAGYVPCRVSYRQVRDGWASVQEAVDQLVRLAGGPPPARVPEARLPRLLGPRGSRPWRLGLPPRTPRAPQQPPARRPLSAARRAGAPPARLPGMRRPRPDLASA
jgi:very-short-patch-repair endonuclease